jgi:hypothetical protein
MRPRRLHARFFNGTVTESTAHRLLVLSRSFGLNEQ